MTKGSNPKFQCLTNPSALTAFSREDFVYDHATYTYRCPAGKFPQHYRRPFTMPRTGVMKDNSLRYRAGKHDCELCPPEAALLPKCSSPQDLVLNPRRRARPGGPCTIVLPMMMARPPFGTSMSNDVLAAWQFGGPPSAE